jgi:hypothetical protein
VRIRSSGSIRSQAWSANSKAAVEVPPYSTRTARSKPLSILTSARVRRLKWVAVKASSGCFTKSRHFSRREATCGRNEFPVTNVYLARACSLTGDTRPPALAGP